MHRFDRPLALDNVLFLLVLVVTAACVADRYLRDERNKDLLVQAKSLRQASEARLVKPCLPRDDSTTQSDVADGCASDTGARR